MTDERGRDALSDVIRSMRPERPDSRPNDEYLVPSVDPAADALLARVISTPARSRRLPWSRTTLIVLAVSTLVGAGVTTAVLLTRSPTDEILIGCMQSADDDASMLLVAPEAGLEPVDQCRDLWSNGALGDGEVPPLTACVTSEGRLRVVPGDQPVCAALGWLPDATAEVTVTDPAAELTSRLSDTFAGSCFDPAEAVAAATDILTELGLVDWTVDTGGTVEGRCNHPSPVHQTKTIAFSPL